MADRSLPLEERLTALEEAVAVANGRLDDELVTRAKAVLEKARQRLERGPDVVVAALAGGTGSGKSSLFNALAGDTLSRVGPVRPVTEEAVSLAVGDVDAGQLLSWLGVRRRHEAAPSSALPEGLVLVDLPDHDSVVSDHREVVDRFVERVDVLVWVVDPLKYAQRSLHEGYLRLLAAHARVVVVVLNHADAVSHDARGEITADLRRILDSEGLGRAQLVVTSARTGEGIAALRSVLADYVKRRRAVSQRIAGDIGNVAASLGSQVGPPTDVTLAGDRLAAALGRAAGIEVLADAGARSYTDEADDVSRGLLTSAALRRVRRLRNPLRRLRRPEGGVTTDVSVIGVRHAVTVLADQAAGGLPHPWPQRLHAAAVAATDGLPGAVAKAVDRVDVHQVRRRAWWRAAGLLGSLLEAAALAGLLWLAALAVAAWFRLPEPGLPMVRGVPLPSLLALGGGVAVVVLSWVRRRVVRLGARRHRGQILDRLERAVHRAAQERVLEPLHTEIRAHADLAAALRRAAGRPSR